MASFALPDAAVMQVLDLGTAPEIFVEGLAYYHGPTNGLVRAGLYNFQPDLVTGEMRRHLCLKLVYSERAREEVRQALSSCVLWNRLSA